MLRDRTPLLAELPVLDVADETEAFDDLNTVGLSRREVEAALRGAHASRAPRVELGDYVVRATAGGFVVSDAQERALHVGALLARVLPTPLFASRPDRIAVLSRAPRILPKLAELLGPDRLRCLGVPRSEPLAVQLRRLRDLAPTVVVGTVDRLRTIAARWGSEGPQRPVHRVVSVTEGLRADDAEELVAGFAVARVHRVYRADEGLYGQTCAHGRLHLNEDLVVVERAWVDRAARTFQPIVTDLFRTTFPRIRTRLHDVLTEVRGPCPCGSPLRAVERVRRVN